ncbi:type VI secretion system protein TssA [Pseudomonas sp. LRF_L74]|uniref:type VI secretion system protein TssA n=1 Tax=Pseudomonas sp. LRF_L74 TaxID=3369422 RepID=UPI003F63C66C
MLDVSILLNAVSDDAPCGEDLEYDADYLELERLAQGQPERQMGDSVLPAEAPDWRDVRQRAIDLFSRSKDLRLANLFLQSHAALEGFFGLASALELVRDLLAQYWDGLYPLLDADDDNDPTFRINALSGLGAETVILPLRDACLVRSRAFGPISLKAALNATDLQRFPSESLSLEQLRGAFLDADKESLEQSRQALQQARSHIAEIEDILSSQVGSARSVDLEALKQLLRHAVNIFSEHAPGAGDSQDHELHDVQDDASTDAGGNIDTRKSVQAPSGKIASREDVTRNLDKLLEYYAQFEPSSPVPVLLTRAKKLVNADFAEIVRNLIPDGTSQYENLRGPDYD